MGRPEVGRVPSLSGPKAIPVAEIVASVSRIKRI